MHIEHEESDLTGARTVRALGLKLSTQPVSFFTRHSLQRSLPKSKINMASQNASQKPAVIDLDDDTGMTGQYRDEHGSAAAPPAAAVLTVPGVPGRAAPTLPGHQMPRREKTRSPVRASSAREPRQRASAKAMPPTSPTPLVTAKEQHLEALLTSICARVDAVEQQLGSTSQLAGQLNTFAAQIAANEARLEERLLEMANAASVEQRLLQAKLETVEATFRRCNAALQDLQAVVFAAPSGAPPGSEPPGLGGLRDRLDELAREANRSGVKERELDDKLVALTVVMQANHAEAILRTQKIT